MFANTVSKHGPRPLFHINAYDSLKYNDIYHNSLKFKHFLQTSGVKKGDNVMVLGNGSPQWASLLYATNSIGAILVPTFEEQQDHIKSHIINQTKPKIIFNSTKDSAVKLSQHKFIECNHEVMSFNSNFPLICPEPDLDLNNTAVILYTSGTSGLPKGVPLTNLNILSNIEAVSNCANNGIDNVEPSDKFVSFLPWNHCYGLNCELNSIVLNGASLYRNNDLLKLRSDILTHNPTILCTVPRLFQLMHKKISWTEKIPQLVKPIINPIIKTKLFGKNLRYCTVGGSAMPQNLIDFFEGYNVKIFQGYGTTEASPMISLNSSINLKRGSVGKVLDYNEVLINPVEDTEHDNALKLFNNGSPVGEILVRGTNLMTNYYGYDNTESFVVINGVNYYRTGDIGYLEDDYLFITGRIKEQYKLSNGKFVNPSEVESVLLTIPEIQQVVVFGKDADHNSAIIVTNSSEQVIRNKINAMSNQMKKYEVPKHLILTTDPFTTENGLLTQKKSQKREIIIKKYA